MTFGQNLFSTFIGAFLGFWFSIALFFIAYHFQQRTQKNTLKDNLAKELEYNIVFLKGKLEDIGKAIEKITVDNKNTFFYSCNFTGYQALFLNEYFKKGLLYKKLKPKEISDLESLLRHMAPEGAAPYINYSIKSWKEEKLTVKQMLDIMAFERDNIKGYIGKLEEMSQKVVSREKSG